MDLDFLPKNPTYPLLRFVDENCRIIILHSFNGRAAEPQIAAFNAADQNDSAQPMLDAELAAFENFFDGQELHNELIFQRIVDNFLTYTVDLVAEIFSTNPSMIPSGEVDRKMLFGDVPLSELRSGITERIMKQYSQMGVLALSKTLEKNYNFQLFRLPQQANLMKESVDIRNLITHNRAMVDYRYRTDFSSGGRVKGQRISVPDILRAQKSTARIAADIDNRAQLKFNLEKVPSSYVAVQPHRPWFWPRWLCHRLTPLPLRERERPAA